jgi:hypothetical protein
LASPGPRGSGQHEWPALPGPRVAVFEARLAERERLLRAGLDELEEQLAELEALVVSGCAGPVERDSLRDAFETLRRELACITAARRAVETLRPEPVPTGLAGRRAAREVAEASPPGRRDGARSGRRP